MHKQDDEALFQLKLPPASVSLSQSSPCFQLGFLHFYLVDCSLFFFSHRCLECSHFHSTPLPNALVFHHLEM